MTFSRYSIDGFDQRRPVPEIFGLASVVGRIYRGVSSAEIHNEIVQKLGNGNEAAGAWLDLSFLHRALGDIVNADTFQREALGLSKFFRQPNASTSPFRLLAFKTAGDFMTNTPLEFMLEEGDVEVVSLYLDDKVVGFENVPEHDVAILAIGESPASQIVLQKCSVALDFWPRKIVNNSPAWILRLERGQLWRHLSVLSGIRCPWTMTCERADLVKSGASELEAKLQTGDPSFPLILRPEGAHAGTNTVKVETLEHLTSLIPAYAADRLQLSQFIDYASPDGLFRKYRVALIDGVAYPVHLAISSHWMVHYLNAGMGDSVEKREEEASWFNSFRQTFASKHKPAFDKLSTTIELSYFAMDCAETKDGELLIFEIDTAMIIHCMDAGPEYAYKRDPMQKLFAAFLAMLKHGQALNS